MCDEGLYWEAGDEGTDDLEYSAEAGGGDEYGAAAGEEVGCLGWVCM